MTVEKTTITTTSSVIEIAKDANFTLARDDTGRRFVATAAITITLPTPGILGNGFDCRVINDSGGSVVIDGVGATNVTMSDGDVARILEVNSKQRVVDETSTVIGDLFATDPLWDPTVFGTNLDLVHWFDASLSVALDPLSGKVFTWNDIAQPGGQEGRQGKQVTAAKQPLWNNQDEIRFDGAAIGLVLGTQSRAGWENRWLAMLFRINWTAMAAATDSFLFTVNGTTLNTNGNRVPRINFKHATNQLQCEFYSNDGSHSVTVDVPGADDTWHSLVFRREEDAIHASIDDGAEVSLTCYTNSFLDSGSSPTGYIGNGLPTGSNISWGLDTILQGQGSLTTTELHKMHAWMLWKRDAQASLDGGSDYLVDPPTMALSEFHTPRQDSYSTGYRFPTSGGWDDTPRGDALDLAGFTRTFHDHFTSLSTLTDGLTGTGPWYVPAHIDTSGAKFRKPGQSPTDTFTILPDNTTLQIKMSQIGNTGAWYSGHLQSVDSWANGFTQTVPSGGALYYEARLAFNYLGGNSTVGFTPNTSGWGAFWLYSQNQFKDSSTTLAEIDVVEVYGATGTTTTQQHHATAFTHPAYRPQPGNIPNGTTSRTPSKVTNMVTDPTWNIPTALFDGQGAGTPGNFHTYGVMIDETWMTWYFDEKVISRFPTYKEALGPLYHIISFQSQDNVGDANKHETYMWVDYCDAYIKS